MEKHEVTIQSLLESAANSCKKNEIAILHELSRDPYQIISDQTNFTTWEVADLIKGWQGDWYLILSAVSCARNWSYEDSRVVIPAKSILGGRRGEAKEDLTFSSSK